MKNRGNSQPVRDLTTPFQEDELFEIFEDKIRTERSRVEVLSAYVHQYEKTLTTVSKQKFEQLRNVISAVEQQLEEMKKSSITASENESLESDRLLAYKLDLLKRSDINEQLLKDESNRLVLNWDFLTEQLIQFIGKEIASIAIKKGKELEDIKSNKLTLLAMRDIGVEALIVRD